jgi:ferritin-like metal-binding protein YciE
MAGPYSDKHLIKCLHQTKALECQVRGLLEAMITRTDESDSIDQLQKQKQEATERERLLSNRLRDYDSDTAQATATSDAQQTRAAYITEHLETSYDLLERLASEVGDTRTAKIARQNRDTESGVGQRISQSLDRITRSSRYEGWIN